MNTISEINTKAKELSIYIKHGVVYYKHSNETITVERLNKGLSEFYGKDVKVNISNVTAGLMYNFNKSVENGTVNLSRPDTLLLINND